LRDGHPLGGHVPAATDANRAVTTPHIQDRAGAAAHPAQLQEELQDHRSWDNSLVGPNCPNYPAQALAVERPGHIPDRTGANRVEQKLHVVHGREHDHVGVRGGAVCGRARLRLTPGLDRAQDRTGVRTRQDHAGRPAVEVRHQKAKQLRAMKQRHRMNLDVIR